MHARSYERPQEDRKALAKMVTQAFKNWDLENEESLAMLGLSEGSRGSLSRYRNGEPLNQNRDMMERAGHILAIHKNLRLMFPHDRERAYQWMRTRNRAFNNLTPAEVVSQYGFQGLLMVRAYLDRARGH
ncbi:conserved hypothetical protein (plasmid) [Thioalkalivibrio sp. K90mix]|uniref:MbcA/ParS/Xre antitoxin family protein n=1 Tax=Thioalkalivibrio sp. (strain K90mix) TaxID=396595 RepID=UPI000195A4D1|nr:MbcA/ParS/Xre antitoxin family protein [Thioalkalivibrio sp. K90mix]ADC73200.1 conserved hypothetical protein [Thioalkalivibrio sp. K90mix]